MSARSLEGTVFNTSYNNGVTALVSAQVLAAIERVDDITAKLTENFSLPATSAIKAGLSHICTKPVFTFTRTERFVDSPWFTGTDSDFGRIKAYIERAGGWVVARGFYVPFSNGLERGLHGEASQRDELKFVTTAQQFRESFGAELNDIRNGQY